jgi:hypothetical protein
MREPASFATTEGSLVGDTRWPGSIQRWPVASVFGPGPRGGSVPIKQSATVRNGMVLVRGMISVLT